MAAQSLPMLDLLTEARAGGYVSNHHPMDTSQGAVNTLREAPASFQFATRQNPRGEVEYSQFYGSCLMWLDNQRTRSYFSTTYGIWRCLTRRIRTCAKYPWGGVKL